MRYVPSSRSLPLRLAALLGALMFVLAACSGDDASTDDASTDDAPPGEAAVEDASTTSTGAESGEGAESDEGTEGDTAVIPPDAFVVRASSDIGIGQERLLLGLSTADGSRLEVPDAEVEISVAPQADPSRVQTAPGIWTNIVPDVTGLFRATFDFNEPGIWQATLTPVGGEPLEPVFVEVFAEPSAPALGSVAPVPATPTLADHPIEELTTDPDPDPAFYEVTLEDAIATGQPTVIVFSTPAYCQTASCGPLLDHVKNVAPDFPDVNFIHVEVFTGLTDPDFAPDAAHLAPAANIDGFALPSEPWVFVIDGGGIVTGRFEGVMAEEELSDALSALAE